MTVHSNLPADADCRLHRESNVIAAAGPASDREQETTTATMARKARDRRGQPPFLASHFGSRQFRPRQALRRVIDFNRSACGQRSDRACTQRIWRSPVAKQNQITVRIVAAASVVERSHRTTASRASLERPRCSDDTRRCEYFRGIRGGARRRHCCSAQHRPIGSRRATAAAQ